MLLRAEPRPMPTVCLWPDPGSRPWSPARWHGQAHLSSAPAPWEQATLTHCPSAAPKPGSALAPQPKQVSKQAGRSTLLWPWYHEPHKSPTPLDVRAENASSLPISFPLPLIPRKALSKTDLWFQSQSWQQACLGRLQCVCEGKIPVTSAPCKV